MRDSLPAEVKSSERTLIGNDQRVWDLFGPDYNCPLLKERIGRIGDGGKWVCGLHMLAKAHSCLVYSLGSLGETSFEDDIMELTNCEVSQGASLQKISQPKADQLLNFLTQQHERLNTQRNQQKHCAGFVLLSQSWQEVALSQNLQHHVINKAVFIPLQVHTFDPTLNADTEAQVEAKSGLHFHPIGISGSSSDVKLAASDMEPGSYHSLRSVMAQLGHKWIDILKIDIEWHEWSVLSDFYSTPGATLPATQLLVEFHFPNDLAKVLKVFDLLLADNFRVFSVEPNYYCGDGCCARDLLEYAFIKVAPSGHLCTVHRHHDEVETTAEVQMLPVCTSRATTSELMEPI
jgi:hypothetical protein